MHEIVIPYYRNDGKVAPTFKNFNISCISMPYQSNPIVRETLNIYIKKYVCIKLWGLVNLDINSLAKEHTVLLEQYIYIYIYIYI